MNHRQKYLKNLIVNRSLEALVSIDTRLHSTKRKKCLIYGNCQARPLSRLLIANKKFSNKYQIINFKPVYRIEKQDLYSLKMICKQIDVFLYQPVKTGYRGIYEIGSDYLKSLLKPGAQSISFHSLFFNAYNPETLYINKIGSDGVYQGPSGDYHNKNIIDMFVRKESIAGTVNYLTDSHAKDRSIIKSKLKESIDELYRRERVHNIDVKMAKYVEDNYQFKRLFWTFNHPSNDILQRCSNYIFRRLGIRLKETFLLKRLLSSELLNATSFSIHPSIYKALELRFNNPQFNIIKKRPINLTETVKLFFNFYNNNPEVVEAYLEKRN